MGALLPLMALSAACMLIVWARGTAAWAVAALHGGEPLCAISRPTAFQGEIA